jgi:hypothetical protein
MFCVTAVPSDTAYDRIGRGKDIPMIAPPGSAALTTSTPRFSPAGPLEPLTVWGLVLRRSETAYFDLTGFHSRLVEAPHGQQGWSGPQPVRIIATSQRMLCDTGTTWRSLWYDDVIGFYPDLDNGAVVLDLDHTAPVKLTGPPRPPSPST